MQSGLVERTPDRVLTLAESMSNTKINEAAGGALRIAAGAVTDRELDPAAPLVRKFATTDEVVGLNSTVTARLPAGTIIQTAGKATAGDGGGGTFRVRANTGGETDNGGTRRLLADGRVIEYVGWSVNARVFGVSAGAAAADNATRLQAAIDALKSQEAITVPIQNGEGAARETQIRNDHRTLILPHGVIKYDATLTVDGDLSIVSEGRSSGSTVLYYTGDSYAMVINSDDISSPLGSAVTNVRAMEMAHFALYGPSASEGIRIGGRVLRHIEFKSIQVVGIQGIGINAMGPGIYFFGMHNCEVRGCLGDGLRIGEYSDLVTIDDRSLFSSNGGYDIVLKCPTFLITNVDFEGPLKNKSAHIRVTTLAGADAMRGGIITGNRFGSESYDALSTGPHVDYDISIDNDGETSTTDTLHDLIISENLHLSKTDDRQKVSPVYIAARTKRFKIHHNRAIGYASNYYVTGDQATAYATGTVYDSEIDSWRDVHPDICGLFKPTKYENVERCIASATIAAGAVVYAGLHYSDAQLTGTKVVTLTASFSALNYHRFYGVALGGAAANQGLYVAKAGALIETTLDASGGALNDPVFFDSSGQLSLSHDGNRASLVVGRVRTATANATVLITQEAFPNEVVLAPKTVTIDPASIAAGAAAQTTHTVYGCAVGDKINVFPPYDTEGATFHAVPSAENTVRLTLTNPTAGAIDLDSGDWQFRVIKKFQ